VERRQSRAPRRRGGALSFYTMALEHLTGSAIGAFTRGLTGARALWKGCAPLVQTRVYYGNHTSHGDFVLIWASLPDLLRRRTRPVAGADYWETSRLRRWLIHDVFRGVLIDRTPVPGRPNAVAQMKDALDGEDSLILFPEGTRNTTDETLLPFKSGIYHLSRERTDVEFVPVWIENLNRVMPKGEVVPIPLLCSVTFGTPLRAAAAESKDEFLERARAALLALAPPRE
jgi:1-acyl-sn-glycerol-3-phosphate acyltransferase